MKLIKLIFWLAATIILAYYMTDIKWGGKSLKQHLDGLIHSEQGFSWRQKAGDWIKGGFKLPMSEEALQQPLPQFPEEITADDRKELENVIRNSK